MPSVAELRRQGNKVKVMHRRWYVTDTLKPEYLLFTRFELEEFCLNNPVGAPLLGPLSCGGATLVEITSTDGKNAVGMAECSLTDNFNRRFGLTKALGRALSNLNKE